MIQAKNAHRQAALHSIFEVNVRHSHVITQIAKSIEVAALNGLFELEVGLRIPSGKFSLNLEFPFGNHLTATEKMLVDGVNRELTSAGYTVEHYANFFIVSWGTV